jgi:hypothetical protein
MKYKIATWHACIVFSICLFIAGCGILGQDGSSNCAPIEGPVIFRIVEDHIPLYDERNPEIWIFMETEKIYGCMNFTINTNIEFREDTISVELLSIYQPGVCLTALGLATFNTSLALEPGEYCLLFYSMAKTDVYNLEVTDSSIRVQEQIAEVTIPEDNLAWRYPQNSFAYDCRTTEETAWICSDFYDSLMTIGNLREFNFPDSGLIPYPVSSQGHYYNHDVFYFLYDNEADFDLVGAKLEAYNEAVISQYIGVSIYIVNWRNKWYRS